HVAHRRRGNPRQHFQQRALAGAVAPDDADDFALSHVERDVAQRPDSIVAILGFGTPAIQQSSDATRRRPQHVGERIPQGAVPLALAEAVLLRDAVDGDGVHRCYPRPWTYVGPNFSSGTSVVR